MEMPNLYSIRHQQPVSYGTMVENTSETRSSVEHSSQRLRTPHYNAPEEQTRSTGPERGLTKSS